MLAAALVAIAYGILSFILFEERGFRNPYMHAAKFGIGLIAICLTFYSGMFQLYLGWSAAISSLLLLGFCILDFRGMNLMLGLISVCASAGASYLLLRDVDIRTKRKEILQREWR